MTGFHTQRGLTLIEVMVGIAISLVLLLGMSIILIQERDTFTDQTVLQRYQEDTRMANIMLLNAIQNAGSVGVALMYNAGSSQYEDADGNAYTTQAGKSLAEDLTNTEDATFVGTNAISSPVANSGATASFPHSVTVQYKSYGALLDCLGNDVGSSGAGCIAASTFTVDKVNRQLTCAVNNCGTVTAATPLVENIEDMAVRYGVDTDTDGSVDQYIWPSEVSDWKEVLAVQISLLTASADEVSPVSKVTTYFSGIGANGGAGLPSANDQRVRREINVTIPINRRLHSGEFN